MIFHKYRFSVRGYELDSFNHVNNSVYLNYTEAARWDFFLSLGWIEYMKETRLGAIVVETNIRYASELNVFDEVLLSSSLAYSDEYLIATQNITRISPVPAKIAKVVTKMLFVSAQKIVHDIPKKFKEQIDGFF